MKNSRILYLFTRTPLHVGAGASVGAIDQPIQRERHTGFPIIPASSLKGTFVDEWEANLEEGEGSAKKKFLRVITKRNEANEDVVDKVLDSAWLFGSNNDKASFSGALQFGEAKLLAFPIRSARGSFAWLTCPLMLARAARDGVAGVSALPAAAVQHFNTASGDDRAIFVKQGPLAVGDKIVLEEYTFSHVDELPAGLGSALGKLLTEEGAESDPVWREIESRLVIISDGMMSYFARNSCEVAQHVRICDETGTAAEGALFNQENVPSETLFYAVVHAADCQLKSGEHAGKTAANALDLFAKKIHETAVFQFGGDASTGLGYCSLKLTSTNRHAKS